MTKRILGCLFGLLAVAAPNRLQAQSAYEPYTFTTLAGLAGSSGSADGTGSAARFSAPWGVATDAAGNVYVADDSNHTIRKITHAGVVTTLAGLAGTSGSADGTASSARFKYPSGVATDPWGNVYVADYSNHTIRKITPAAAVTTLAGLAGISGSADGTGSAARFYYPAGVATDASGNVYVADSDNYTIRKITSAGVVSTLAGLAGSYGSADGTGSAARFGSPWGIATDASGDVYVADSWNYTIRKVTPAGVVSTLAGRARTSGSADGTGSAARFNYPYGVATDGSGNVYVADTDNSTIRKIAPAGVVTTLAGLAGSFGSTDGTCSAARFNYPFGVATDAAGNIYVADDANKTIRKGFIADQLHRVVQNVQDSGPGSLRDALNCVSPGATITFAPNVAGTITLTSGKLYINTSLTILGPGAAWLAISGNNHSRVFHIGPQGNVEIHGLTIRDGRSCAVDPGGDGVGGGIINGAMLTLADCAIVGNLTCGANGTNGVTTTGARSGGAGGNGWGGGIYNTGQLCLFRCAVANNESRGGVGGNGGPGGSLSALVGRGGAGGAGFGGGLYNLGAVVLRDCTFLGNFARGASGGGGGGTGTQPFGGTGGAGGSALGGGVLNDNLLTVANSTFATNQTLGGFGGAGGYGGDYDGAGGSGGSADGGSLYNRGTNYLVNATVAGGANTGGTGGNGLTVGSPGLARGGGVFASVPFTYLLNSIIGRNTAASGGADVFGAVTSSGHNLIGIADGGSGWVGTDLLGSAAAPLDPMLGALGLDFGSTFSYALQTNSPAVNAGDDAVLAEPWSLTTDQRGFPRREGGHVDIGAYELCRNLPTFEVTTPRDDGPGSLRAGVECVTPGGTITFAADVAGTIELSGFPSGLVIDKDLTIQGPGANVLAVSGRGGCRVLHVLGGNVTISGLMIRDGRGYALHAGADGLGGGIFNGATLTLADCAIIGNVACGANGTNGTTTGSSNGGSGGNGWGGGIYNTGQLALVRCTIASNQSRGSAGGNGASTVAARGGAGGSGFGGGLYNAGTASLFGCTFAENQASGGTGGVGGKGFSAGGAGGVGGPGLGGAILNDSALTVINCTFATNLTWGGHGGAGGPGSEFYGVGGKGGNADGGNILNRGTQYLVNATIVGGATAGGMGGSGDPDGSPGLARGGGVFASAHSAFLINTLIGDNSAAGGSDLFGPVTSLGHNLISITNGSSGLTNSDLLGSATAPLKPLLQPLGAYGGATVTLLPQPGSPLLDAGDDAVLAAPWFLATDQRGGLRQAGAHVDIGAVETGGLLRVTDIRDATNCFDISFTTEFGWPHHLESKDALNPALPWVAVPGSDRIGTGGVLTVPDTRPRSPTNRFFRPVMNR